MGTIIAEKQESEKIMALLKTEYPQLLSTMERNLANWGDGETFVDTLPDTIKAFKKFDQGSLSFTVTALRHAGYETAWGVLECIDEVINKREHRNGNSNQTNKKTD